MNNEHSFSGLALCVLLFAAFFVAGCGSEQPTERSTPMDREGQPTPVPGSTQTTERSPAGGERTMRTFAAISSGDNHTCGLRKDGSPVCRGRDEEGQASPPEDETFAAISSGEDHTCGLRTDGSAVCWGSDRYGQASPPDGQTFTAISSGENHTCGLTAPSLAGAAGRAELHRGLSDHRARIEGYERLKGRRLKLLAAVVALLLAVAAAACDEPEPAMPGFSTVAPAPAAPNKLCA